jgi:hypothetical protein
MCSLQGEIQARGKEKKSPKKTDAIWLNAVRISPEEVCFVHGRRLS